MLNPSKGRSGCEISSNREPLPPPTIEVLVILLVLAGDAVVTGSCSAADLLVVQVLSLTSSLTSKGRSVSRFLASSLRDSESGLCNWIRSWRCPFGEIGIIGVTSGDEALPNRRLGPISVAFDNCSIRQGESFFRDRPIVFLALGCLEGPLEFFLLLQQCLFNRRFFITWRRIDRRLWDQSPALRQPQLAGWFA